MIYIDVPNGDHGWGVVGDNLAHALGTLAPMQRLPRKVPPPPVLPGPLLQLAGRQFRRTAGVSAARYVGYAVFDEDLGIRRTLRDRDARDGFDALAAGCRWCESALRDTGLTAVTTIHHGVDHTRFNPQRSVRRCFQDRFVVFSGGKFEFRKAQDVVVRAFRAFAGRHPDALLLAAWHNPWRGSAATMSDSPHFPLAGADDASCDDLVRRWLASTGLVPENVQLVPRIPNADVAAIYGSSDVGLFPNRCEGGTNLVMMEYMACGRAVVATDFAGHRDVLTDANSFRLRASRLLPIVRDGEAVACWCEPNVDEIVECLEQAYCNRDGLDGRGRQAAGDLSEWTWERAARQFLRLLEPTS